MGASLPEPDEFAGFRIYELPSQKIVRQLAGGFVLLVAVCGVGIASVILSLMLVPSMAGSWAMFVYIVGVPVLSCAVVVWVYRQYFSERFRDWELAAHPEARHMWGALERARHELTGLQRLRVPTTDECRRVWEELQGFADGAGIKCGSVIADTDVFMERSLFQDKKARKEPRTKYENVMKPWWLTVTALRIALLIFILNVSLALPRPAISSSVHGTILAGLWVVGEVLFVVLGLYRCGHVVYGDGVLLDEAGRRWVPDESLVFVYDAYSRNNWLPNESGVPDIRMEIYGPSGLLRFQDINSERGETHGILSAWREGAVTNEF